MSRFGYKRTAGDTVYREVQRRKWERFRKNEFAVMLPGPNDLTEQKILERMNRIFVGDKITFDSMKCDRATSQSCATTRGTVVEHCGGYVMVKLHNVIESVSYFDIRTLNGKTWPYYINKDSKPEV